MSWKIYLYESENQKPIEAFIRKLQPSTQAKLIRQFELLEEFGVYLAMPHAKPIGSGLYELRVRGKQEVRVLYVYVHTKSIYVLHAFLKKTNAISAKDLRTAQTRKQELLDEFSKYT